MAVSSLGAANVTPGDTGDSAIEHELTSPEFGLRAFASIRLFVADTAALKARSWVGRLFGVSPVSRESRTLYRDAAAELAVADSVSALGDEWSVVHGIVTGADASANAPRSRDDVSHLATGPNGVFAITTVNARGESVWVASSTFVHDGVRMSHLRDAEYNALRISQLLYEASGVRVEVVPAVVIANPRGLIINRAPRRVFVLTPGEVPTWIRSHPALLAGDELGAVARAAHALAAVDADSSESAEQALTRFRGIRRHVGAARQARITWVTLALVSAWLLLVVAVLLREGWL